MDDQELSVALNDADRRPQCAEQREPVIKSEAGACDNPEQPAFEVIEQGPQEKSLACGKPSLVVVRLSLVVGQTDWPKITLHHRSFGEIAND